MMKKEYIQPEMEVVEIVVSPLLAGSANTLFDDTAGGNESLGREMDEMFLSTESILGVPGL